MQIRTIVETRGDWIPVDRLLSYLSQMVLTMTDDEVHRKREILEEKKNLFGQKRHRLKRLKDNLVKVSVEYRRLKMIERILDTVDALKREGVLIGNNRVRVYKLLQTLHRQDITSLKAINDRLQLYLPDGSL